jgi:cytochrome c oxidase subunit II
MFTRYSSQSIHLHSTVAALFIVALLLAGCITPMDMWSRSRPIREYASNGEQIYFTSTSQRGTRITFDMHAGMMGGRGRMGQGGMMMSGQWACADCHGPDGRGGTARMMMTTFVAPDIRYTTLTSDAMEHEGHGEEGHPPYTEETLKRAITQGIDPAGEPLQWPMPRWSMGEDDLNDLLAFLQTLE